MHHSSLAPQKPRFILFDVNETLLDMSKVKKRVNSALGSKRGAQIWFGLLLHYSLVDNCTNQYHNFSEIAQAALDMAATKLETTVTESDKKEVLELMIEMQPYKDVKKGLELLQQAGFRLATLTNSTGKAQQTQLTNGGILSYFDTTLSVDDFKKYKPFLEVYRWAAELLQADPAEIIMVAAHGWDITGAANAGLKTAFVARKGQEIYPLAPSPNIVGKNITDVAKAIIKHYKNNSD